MRIAIVCRESPGEIDAIRDASARLAEALRETGAQATLCLRTPRGRWRSDGGEHSGLVDGVGGSDLVVLQYNPFLYGRWGFAPWLPAALVRLRRRARVALVVHEPFVPMLGWRSTLMGLWQRAQLRAAHAAAHVAFASIEAWTEELRGWRPRRPVAHFPGGSNLPDRRREREATRARLGVDERVVLASLGTAHPSRRLDLLVAAANACAATRDVALLHLGAGAPALSGLDERVTLHAPGALDDDELAAGLAAADLFLAPFVDGVSTRRSSMLAALQHGLGVVGTDGPLTDGMLRRSRALRLAPVERADDFVRVVVELVADDGARRALGEEARALYEREFDWPVAARRLLEAVR